MALKVMKGETAKVSYENHGTSAKGDWQFLIVEEEGRKFPKKIKIWVDNAPVSVQKGDVCQIGEISGVVYGAEKDKNDQWHDAVSINAKVIPALGQQTSLEEVSVDEAELPF